MDKDVIIMNINEIEHLEVFSIVLCSDSKVKKFSFRSLTDGGIVLFLF